VNKSQNHQLEVAVERILSGKNTIDRISSSLRCERNSKELVR